jgi:hypothetical protein
MDTNTDTLTQIHVHAQSDRECHGAKGPKGDKKEKKRRTSEEAPKQQQTSTAGPWNKKSTSWREEGPGKHVTLR